MSLSSSYSSFNPSSNRSKCFRMPPVPCSPLCLCPCFKSSRLLKWYKHGASGPAAHKDSPRTPDTEGWSLRVSFPFLSLLLAGSQARLKASHPQETEKRQEVTWEAHSHHCQGYQQQSTQFRTAFPPEWPPSARQFRKTPPLCVLQVED